MTEPEILHSEYNDAKPLGGGRPLRLYDTTLRDGEQTLGVALNRYQKLEIAQMLEELGVPRIECGMPVISDEDYQAAKLIVQNVRRSELFGFCRCVKKDVDACLELGLQNVVCELPLSDVKHRAYRMTQDQAIERLVSTISYAKSQGMFVSFFGIDATRTGPDFLKRAYVTAVETAGADEVVVVDTLGIATPEGMARMTSLVKSWVGVPVAVHCHDDMGCGIACTFAAFGAGAEEAHVTFNGLGERTGNVDLAALAVSAKVLYGVDTGIDCSKLYAFSRRAAKLTGIPIPGNRPVIGENVFVRESGLTVQQMAEYPPAVEPFPPELIGAERSVSLGKNSGKASVEFMLHKLGLSAEEDQKADLLKAVKTAGSRKGTSLTEDEFRKLVQQTVR